MVGFTHRSSLLSTLLLLPLLALGGCAENAKQTSRADAATDAKPPCPAVECDGICVDLMVDRLNCGSCGHGCPVACSQGACVTAIDVAVEGAVVEGAVSCAVLSDSTARCWGFVYDSIDAAGNLTGHVHERPLPVVGLSGATNIAMGEKHMCALVGGSVWCWGSNASGQLGTGSKVSSLSPTLVPGLEKIVQISLGKYHSCALSGDGTVYCWGSNARGQIGDGSTTGHLEPMAVPGLPRMVQIGAGSQSTCGLTEQGTVLCWGAVHIGDGTDSDRPSPTAVSGLSNITKLFRFSNSCWTVYVGPPPYNGIPVCGDGGCALSASGNLWCWGTLGHYVYSSPTVCSDLAGVVDLAAWLNSRCAILADSSLWCWGDNILGQLGIGPSYTFDIAPTRTIPEGVVKVAMAEHHGCALLRDGSVSCWGSNSRGEVGSTSKTPPGLTDFTPAGPTIPNPTPVDF
jgi:hypothetical protein